MFDENHLRHKEPIIHVEYEEDMVVKNEDKLVQAKTRYIIQVPFRNKEPPAKKIWESLYTNHRLNLEVIRRLLENIWEFKDRYTNAFSNSNPSNMDQMYNGSNKK